MVGDGQIIRPSIRAVCSVMPALSAAPRQVAPADRKKAALGQLPELDGWLGELGLQRETNCLKRRVIEAGN
jgi:hypothetical protein